VLRLIHYPPVPPEADPNCVRSAAHEDINFLTILVAARGAGLELLDRDGRWLPVETEPRNLIVDSGDMLARLTNDVIPATTHRVVNPAGPNVSRYSMPFFMHPTESTSLRCLPSCLGVGGAKYPETTAGAFLAQRLREIGLAK
jgi:isopenicillin N synthase-like dioxygenase